MRESSEVESSIYSLLRGFALSVLHAILIALPIHLDCPIQRVLQGHGERANGLVFPMKEHHCDAEADDEGEEGRSPPKDGNEVGHCVLLRLARRFRESTSAVHGTSTDVNRTHPDSV